MKMILSIGSKQTSLRPSKSKKAPRRFPLRGLTFFELMVAIVILNLGILAIYKAFLNSLNYQNHLTNRLYAMHYLNQKMSMLQSTIQKEGEVQLIPQEERHVVILNNQTIIFQFNMNISIVNGLKGIFQVDMTLSWLEQGRPNRIMRSSYIPQSS